MELNEWLVLVLLTLVAIGGLLFASGWRTVGCSPCSAGWWRLRPWSGIF